MTTPPRRSRSVSVSTPEQRAERAEQQLAEALTQLDRERQRVTALEAKLREHNIPFEGISSDPTLPVNGLSDPELECARSPNAPASIRAIYTDGACSGNPGRGGWGTVIYFTDGTVHEIGGFDAQTTNNRMEMQAAIAALEYLAATQYQGSVILYTDSEYLKNGITQWINGWKKKGWITSTGKPVLNQDLWKILDTLNSRQVEWRYVRGHAGNEGNERCDTIARAFTHGKNPNLSQIL